MCCSGVDESSIEGAVSGTNSCRSGGEVKRRCEEVKRCEEGGVKRCEEVRAEELCRLQPERDHVGRPRRRCDARGDGVRGDIVRGERGGTPGGAETHID